MDSTVVAAAIGVGGTVIVGVAGFWATVSATRKTIQAGRDNTIWDKRAEVYVDAIAAVHYRQTRRAHDVQRYRLDDQAERQYQAYLAAYSPPDWYRLEACLIAFGSEPVFTALQASSTADQRALDALGEWKTAPEVDMAQRAQSGPLPPGPTVANPSLYEAAEKARKAADDADDVLIEIIREGLQGKGQPLGQWPPTKAPDRVDQQGTLTL